jgi:hypothetical protein
MLNSKFLILFIILITVFFVTSNSYATKIERGMGSGYLYKLFLKPEPDFKFSNINYINNLSAPSLPFKNKEDVILSALTNNNIKQQIFESVFDSHKGLGWLVFSDKKKGGWIINVRSQTSIPEYKCYFAIDNEGNMLDMPIPHKGCVYYSNK